MKHIFELQTDLMRPLHKYYPHVKIYNSHQLLKIISQEQLSFVLQNVGKRVEKVVLPEEIFKFYFKNTYCYTQEWIKWESDLSGFKKYEEKFSDQEILIFYRNLLETLSQMHIQGISSGDLWFRNILLNDHLDYRFIDLELRTDLLFLSFGYQDFPYQGYSFSDEIKISDKVNLLTMILYSMLHGEFLRSRILHPIIRFEPYCFPNSIEEKWGGLMRFQEPPKEDDYFLEEMDSLIRLNYSLPYRRK